MSAVDLYDSEIVPISWMLTEINGWFVGCTSWTGLNFLTSLAVLFYGVVLSFWPVGIVDFDDVVVGETGQYC